MSDKPSVRVSQMVYWYPDGDRSQDPFGAIVTRVGPQSIALAIFEADRHTIKTMDGVIHMDDPRLDNVHQRSQGGWDHTAETKELKAMQAKVNGFAMLAEQLKQKKSEPKPDDKR